MVDASALQYTKDATRAERRRVMKDELKYRKRSEPGMQLPPVPIRNEHAQQFARALDPIDRMTLYALMDGRDERYLTFREFVDRAYPGYQWGAHLVALSNRLQDVADGLIRRLMVFMPPRHGKSEMVSRLFTAYYVYRHPTRDVAITTYGAELSYDLSRDARSNFLALGGELAGDSSAIKSWHTSRGGNVWATGVGGPATGRGYALGIIDDPYKDHEEAASAKIRRTRWNWYKSVFRTRAAPGAAIVLLMTRWHMDDIAANLLREESVTRAHWHVVEMAAEKRVEREPTVKPTDVDESLSAMLEGALDPLTGAISDARGRHKWPATVTLEPDARDDDTWLWTARFPIAEYVAVKREMGGESGYFWNAMYQQRPVANEGGLFRREWFAPIARASLPRMKMVVRWWDMAATEAGGAYTAGLKVGRGVDDHYYILGLQHGQWHPGKRDTIIKRTAQLDGPRVTVLVPQDPGAAGKQVAQQLVRMLSGIARCFAIIESGDKDTRATLPAGDAANGLFHIVAEPWAAVVLQELADFGPAAEYRDIVDALSGAHGYVAEKRERRVPRSTSSSTMK